MPFPVPRRVAISLTMTSDGNLVLALIDPHGSTPQETLQPDDELLPGQTIIAPDGDFEIRSSGGIREWYTATYAPADGSVVELSSTGDIELVDPAGSVTWSSDRSATLRRGASPRSKVLHP